MFKKLLPVLFVLVGLAAGGGIGLVLRPDKSEDSAEENSSKPDCALPESVEATDIAAQSQPTEDGAEPASEFVKLNNQFIVPVVEGNIVDSLVILSMSIETQSGSAEKVYAQEPKLRDSFLQVLFDHANAGGFAGNFTAADNMEVLRNSLLEVARQNLGATVVDVLIESIVRQDA